MKRFWKELLLFAVVFVVAVASLIQLFHEEAYAVPICAGYCNNQVGCDGHLCGCPECPEVTLTCHNWCTVGCGCPPGP